MLKPIKIFYIDSCPNLYDWQEAIAIAKSQNCVVEIKWCPHVMAGWYHQYVFEDSDPETLNANTPKVYGI